MIYVGLIHFNDISDKIEELKSSLQSFTESPPSVLRKNSLVICYGKLSEDQDFDEIWENESSLLIGRIFDKRQNSTYKKEDFKNLAHLSKEEALKKIWGKYVHFNVNKTTSQFDITLDSTGQLPFFYYPFPNGNVLFSSDIEIIYKVLSQKPDYNWTYLCSYFIYGNSSSIQTPFNNIYELPPACSLKITKNERKTAPFWNPLSTYKTLDTQKRDAVDVLKDTLKAWVKPYQNIVVSLSGGLDSSSLVYCLKDIVKKDQTLKAVNYFHAQIKSSNELVHARRVCQETGIELIEIDASNSLPFDPSHQKNRLKPNKPFPGLVSLRWMETIFDQIPFREPFTFVSGHGSDHIFMRPPSKKSVSDYILERGFKGFKKELENIAQFYRDPFFLTLKENVKSLSVHSLGMKKERRNIKENLKNIPKWVNHEVLQSTSSTFFHPIYEHLPLKILPGKYDQVDAFYEGLASIHMEMMNQADPTYFPFLYQPVVEFALSFPTYELFDKGYDRYPLRKSVSDRFKTDTVWRRDKSQTTGLFQLGVKKNLEQILETCLDGHFVKRGLIDREELHKTITLIGNGDIKNIWPFLYVASTEMFLKHWDDKIQ